MDFDSGTLVRILEVCSGAESAAPGETVHLIRQGQHSFAPTMYSVWDLEGQPLNPALRHELDVQRERIQRYRELTAVITERVPTAVPLKGLQVGALYPPDVVRYQNDLDYVVPDRPGFWDLSRLLVELKWDIESATFVRCRGELHLMVSFRKPNEDLYALPYGVEIATHVTLGDLAGVPPIIDLPPAWRTDEVKNLVMLLFERFEQPYRARDLVDAALQLRSLGTERFSVLAAEVGRLGLWPEYTELRTLLEKVELGPLPPAAPSGALAEARARRVARMIAPFSRPVPALAKNLQRRMIYRGLSRPERTMWTLAEERLPSAWALRTGLLCFGLPIEGGPTDGRDATIGENNRVCWADTPIGRFLLTHGNEIDEDALKSLPGSDVAESER